VIGRLGMVMLVVGDLRTSLHFYRDLLGLELKASAERWVELDAGNILLSLHAAGEDVGPNATSGCSLGVYVDDVEHTTAVLKERGARVGREPFRIEFGNVFSVILDPDGYRVQLLES
jgi:lactoylglutathione lyase